MEIIDLQEDISLKMYTITSTEDFWTKHVLDKYMHCTTLALKLATMFGFTYICETSFSKMTFKKTKYYPRLTDQYLENTLRNSCSPRVPNLKKNWLRRKKFFSLNLKFKIV